MRMMCLAEATVQKYVTSTNGEGEEEVALVTEQQAQRNDRKPQETHWRSYHHAHWMLTIAAWCLCLSYPRSSAALVLGRSATAAAFANGFANLPHHDNVPNLAMYCAPCGSAFVPRLQRFPALGAGGGGDDGTTTEVVKCKTTWIGQVVGPQGSTVNEIKTTTGAEIEISESGQDSLVTISGSKNAVNAAKARVEEIIKDAEDPDYEGSEGRKWREEADRCAQMVEECAKEKDALFEKGDKRGGHKKLVEVKEYQRKMHEANGKAAEAIFNNRNKGKGDRYMDFHGLRKQEALDILETKMSALKGKGGDVELIPGAGHHSQGAAVLKPAMLGFLKKEGLKYEEQSAGVFLVHL